MITFFGVLCFLIVLVCILIVIITMVQNSKKEEQGNTLGGLGAHVLMGVKQTNDILIGGTWILVITLVLLVFCMHKNVKPKQQIISPNLEYLKKQTEQPSTETKKDTKSIKANDKGLKKVTKSTDKNLENKK